MNQITEENRRHAAISYLLFFSLIILYAKGKNEFIRHHAIRGLILFVLISVSQAFPLLRIFHLLWLLLILVGFASAHQGKLNLTPILLEVGKWVNNKITPLYQKEKE